MQTQLDFKDIQALVFTGYGKLRLARYAFFQIVEREKVKRWLGSLADRVNTGDHGKEEGAPETALHVAFTAPGLLALGLPEEALETFPREFVQGMAHPDRARVLGDTGESRPERWCFGGSGEDEKPGKQRDIHLVLILFTADDRKGQETQRDFFEEEYALCKAHGLKEVFHQDAYLGTLDGKSFKDSFGFSDGISQPVIEGHKPPSTHGMTLKPGEVILGYENAYGQIPRSPTVPASLDPHELLPEAAPDDSRKDLGRNGSYMVIRKLSQNKEAFDAFLKANSRDPQEREWLAAKLVGRWSSGAPLALSPEHDDEQLGEDRSRNNCFGYAQDPHGMLCPIGAHIRRANPRDGLIPGEPRRSLEVVARHQLIRRGRAFEDDHGTSGKSQGLFFVALNASIQRQFEFVQHTWLNSTKFGGHFDSRDPIVGDNPDARSGEDQERRGPASGTMTIPDFPVCRRIDGLTRFVEVQGGGYFFLPGIRALRFLSELKAPDEEVVH